MRRPSSHHRTTPPSRGGYTAPLIIAALLVVLACAALVLDRLWIEGISTELRRGAEVSALAGCRELASDDLLKEKADPELVAGRARLKAADIAAQNFVAGSPLMLNVDPDDDNRDLRIGRRVLDEESGRKILLETPREARTVRVKGERTRSRWNPVALFLHGISGQPVADVIEMAEATIDNRLIALRPYDGVPVPALPIAILERDPTLRIRQTWNEQIDRKLGQDKYSINPDTGEVAPTPDGIREIVLTSMKTGGKPADANVHVIDVGTEFDADLLAEQIKTGWKAEQLENLDGQMNFADGPIPLASNAVIGPDLAELLRAQIGQPRICLVYTNFQKSGDEGLGTIEAVQPVAGRIMAIESTDNGACRIIFQPAVVTTKTAVLAEDEDSEDITPNPYIYKLQLTR